MRESIVSLQKNATFVARIYKIPAFVEYRECFEVQTQCQRSACQRLLMLLSKQNFDSARRPVLSSHKFLCSLTWALPVAARLQPPRQQTSVRFALQQHLAAPLACVFEKYARAWAFEPLVYICMSGSNPQALT